MYPNCIRLAQCYAVNGGDNFALNLTDSCDEKEKLYPDEKPFYKNELSQRHFCYGFNGSTDSDNLGIILPIFCLDQSRWILYGYTSSIKGIANKINLDLTLAWLKDKSNEIEISKQNPFEYSSCCQTIILENNLPSDGIYTKIENPNCPHMAFKDSIDIRKDELGYEYGFEMNSQIYKSGDWSITILENNFKFYFFVVKTESKQH